MSAGARAVVLTVDTQVVGSKITGTGRSVFEVVATRQLRVNFEDGYDAQPGAEKAADLGPGDIAWLREQTGLPVVVKGVLRGDDARMCVDGELTSGLDFLTALALGADAVFAGRGPLLALAEGESGVRRWHDEIHAELSEVLRLSGSTTPRDARGLATS